MIQRRRRRPNRRTDPRVRARSLRRARLLRRCSGGRRTRRPGNSRRRLPPLPQQGRAIQGCRQASARNRRIASRRRSRSVRPRSQAAIEVRVARLPGGHHRGRPRSHPVDRRPGNHGLAGMAQPGRRELSGTSRRSTRGGGNRAAARPRDDCLALGSHERSGFVGRPPRFSCRRSGNRPGGIGSPAHIAPALTGGRTPDRACPMAPRRAQGVNHTS